MLGRVSKRSGELFESGWYCAESVLLAIAENKGVESDLIPKIATGLCAGVARTCGMCGAVSGGILAISLFAGRVSAEESVAPLYEMIRAFLDAFEGKFGSTNCRELTGCDLGTEEGQDYFKGNRIRGKCRNYTEEATSMALTAIEEHLSDVSAS